MDLCHRIEDALMPLERIQRHCASAELTNTIQRDIDRITRWSHEAML